MNFDALKLELDALKLELDSLERAVKAIKKFFPAVSTERQMDKIESLRESISHLEEFRR
jgi:hypothetical protein